jgi:SAM-dependent methyltransferase
MIPVRECPLCGGIDLPPFAASPIRGDRQLHFAQVRCRGCGLLIAQPQAEAHEIDSYYRGRYYEEQWSDGPNLCEANVEMHRRATLPVLDRLCDGWAPPAPALVAEIGCGYGSMLLTMRDRGHRVIGVELSSKAARFCGARGLGVAVGRTPDLPLRPRSCDVVIARHVIEHVARPAAFVACLAAALRPRGLLIIETESAWISQYAWERFRARLVGGIPHFRSSTDHTYVFAAAHLRRLLAAAGCREVRTAAFTEVPTGERLHWRIYKGLFRTIDRAIGAGEMLMAVGQLGA